MAAALLVARTDSAEAGLEVASAGLLYDDRPASEGARAWAQRVGLDLESHRSRIIDRAGVAAADLVLGMEPRHVREVVALDDTAWPRTFTLRELAGRCQAATPREPEQEWHDWLAHIGRDRRRADLLGDDPDLTIADPYRAGPEVYDTTAAQIVAALRSIVPTAMNLRFA